MALNRLELPALARDARRAAMFTRSASEPAFIFCITLPRCAFHGDLADAEFAAALLVHQAGNNKGHDCLSRRLSEA